jgi:3-methyladenine DNA glycosylase AlkD
MQVDDVLAEFERLGTAQHRKIYRRHGVKSPAYGVSYAHLGKMQKRLKTNPELAAALWATGVHDARILACRIDDPLALTVATCNARARDLDSYVITDAYGGLVAKTRHAEGRVAVWVKSRGEWISSAGWGALASLAMSETARPDEFFLPYMARIVAGIHGAPNRTRHAMNNALIAMGVRNDVLYEAAVEAARSIGKVEVDHGETNCTTPDAIAYMDKTRAHYAAKGRPRRRKRC